MNTFFTSTQNHGNTVFTFPQKAKVLSTSPLNGGLTRYLSHAVNINCMNGSYECRMLGDTYEEDLAAHVRSMGLSPSCTTALSTAAWTELRATEEVCFRDLVVTAVVTGGIDSNSMHPGDPSSYYEEEGKYEMLPPGTVNIFLFINQKLSDAAMVRALMLPLFPSCCLGAAIPKRLQPAPEQMELLLLLIFVEQKLLQDTRSHLLFYGNFI